MRINISEIVSSTLSAIAIYKDCSEFGHYFLKNKNEKKIRTDKTITYVDAINAIMKSKMSCHSKNKAIEIISHNKSEDYYRIVINIIKSDMTDFYIIETLKDISKKNI